VKQQAAIQTIHITRKEEVKYFSVRLPKNVSAIIGIETGLRLRDADRQPIPDTGSDWLIRPPAITAGSLLLQSTDDTNVFYSCELVKNDYSLPIGDFSFAYYPLPVKSPKDPALARDRDYSKPVVFWTPQPWTHNRTSEEETIRIPLRSATINGLYKDEYGKAHSSDLAYTVTVCIWYETADCKKVPV